MTKLEEKLVELGYEYVSSYGFYSRLNNDYVMRYEKDTEEDYQIIIDLDYTTKTKIIDCYISLSILRPEDIVNLQQTVKEFEKDLEILKGIDKPTPKNDIGNELWENDVKHMRKLDEWKSKQWNN